MNPEFSDIILPQTVPWWPPAYGWWILVAFLLMALVTAIYYWCKYQKSVSAQKKAIKTIKALPQDAPQSALSKLLKQTLITYLGRTQIAAASSAHLIDIWQRYTPQDQALHDWLNNFYQQQYQKPQNLTAHDIEMAVKLIRSCRLYKEAKHV
ncbi:DUF4381 domain-containing protein [Gayadomonas joobiniege]|uniref:DUF4381 domain-containing protein n=1 Tax=Gayadomonas joobiniege TaxID=1234606 RepID=UPI00035F3508|nr:DUF4381 domain-containing protein [Gayadomonas joobiniege]